MVLVRLSLAFVYVYSIIFDGGGGNGSQLCDTWEVMYHIIAL